MDISKIYESYVVDISTGKFEWNKTSKGIRRGKLGHLSASGYLRVTVEKRYYPAHHLVWFIAKGYMPLGQIDHINGDRSDNRISNLRDVQPIFNSQNQRKAHKTNKCGLLGVSPSQKCATWKAQIRINKINTYIGSYKTPELAHEAYINAKRLYQPGCTI